jgi:predicted aspartyl protease
MNRRFGTFRRNAGTFFVAACWLACARAALANCQINQVAEIPVTFTAANQVLAHGQVNGQPVGMLIDTGSSQSVVWRPAAGQLGLQLSTGPHNVHMYGIGGESLLEEANIKELRFGNFIVKDLRIPAAGEHNSDFAVLLGDDFWSISSIEFDLRHHVVRMLDPKGCKPAELPYWAKTYSMADLIASPHETREVQVDVQLNGRTVRAKIDSGAARSVVSDAFADTAGVTFESGIERTTGIGSGSLDVRVATFQSFTIGDESIKNVKLRVAPLGKNMKTERVGSRLPVAAIKSPEMLLGADFLQAHRVLIDNSTRKLVFTYEGGPIFQTLDPGTLRASTPSEPPPAATPTVSPAAVATSAPTADGAPPQTASH